MKRTTATTATLALLSLIATRRTNAFSSTGPPYDKCNKTDYYEALLSIQSDEKQWTKDQVIDLITSTHRNVLPDITTVQDGDDLILALKDLWAGSTTVTGGEQVRLLYRDIEYDADIANTQLGWEAEHIWPIGRGWERKVHPEPFTDIYGKAPADATVRRRKGDLFFGLCGTVELQDACFTPATSETGPTTQQDGKVFAAPDSHKGDVARAVFYMAARYAEQYNLTLTDCPPFGYSEFGYLSELLRWHEQDPVSDEERQRNQKGCERWQGNRNVFVDYPDLVRSVFYPSQNLPDLIVPDSYTYSQCTKPTPPPTASPGACNEVQAGDLPIFLVNSDDPDQFVLYPLVDFPEGIGTLYITDSAWNGSQFFNTEGTLEFQMPPGGLKAGDVMGWGDGAPLEEYWEQMPNMGNKFDMSSEGGDTLLVYCLDADNKERFITGFSFSGVWLEDGLPEANYSTQHSALPKVLQDRGSIYLTHYDNYVYVGPLRDVPKEELAANMITPAFFDGVDTTRIGLDLSNSAATTTMSRNLWFGSSLALILSTLLLVAW